MGRHDAAILRSADKGERMDAGAGDQRGDICFTEGACWVHVGGLSRSGVAAREDQSRWAARARRSLMASPRPVRGMGATAMRS